MSTVSPPAATLHETAFLPEPPEPRPTATAPSSRSTVAEPPSAGLRFLEAFLDERNIKWMLGLGILVLLGSSLKFVTAHWHAYSPFWKFAVLIAYTAVVYGLSIISRTRLGLRRTGAALQGLTLGLLPLTFLALRWVAPPDAGLLGGLVHDVGLLSLLVINTGFAAYASRRILSDLLRGVPDAYWVAYLILCVSGALAPAVPAALTPVAALALWAVFTAGLIKVNRHVFWLAEEQRWPRIFGFFPSVLLAAQFLTVFGLNFADDFSRPWLGFAIALVAVNVLLTTDAVVRVFQQRTGELVFPWPTHILLPLVSGLGLCALAIGLACSQFPSVSAVPPTALLVAVCLAAVARRTRQELFVWGMLGALLMGYQCLPGYFAETAKQLVQTGAAAVHEPRLPYAFYGLTYAPFLMGLTIAAVRVRNRVFANPCRQMAIGLGTILLCASWTHPKAMFPVGAVLTLFWASLAAILRDNRVTWGAAISWMSASLGLHVFLANVCRLPLPLEANLLFPVVAAGCLWLVSRLLERRHADTTMSPAGIVSAASTAVLAVVWIGLFGAVYSIARHFVPGISLHPLAAHSAGGLLLLLAEQTRRRRIPAFAELTIVFAFVATVRLMVELQVPGTMIAFAVPAASAGLWFLARWWREASPSPWVAAFRDPMQRVTEFSLTLAQALLLPALAWGHMAVLPVEIWVAGLVVTTWTFAAAGRRFPVEWAAVGCLSATGLVGSGMCLLQNGHYDPLQLPLAWSICGLVGVLISRSIARRSADDATPSIAIPIRFCSQGLLFLVAAANLAVLTVEARIAGGLSLLGLVIALHKSQQPALRQLLILVVQLQGLVIALQSLTDASLLTGLTLADYRIAFLPVLALAALEMLILRLPGLRQFSANDDLDKLHRGIWAFLLIDAFVLIPLNVTLPLGGLQTISLAALFVFVAADLILWACQEQSKTAAWLIWPLLAVGVVYLALFGVIEVTSTPFLIAAMAAGIATAHCGTFCRRSPVTAILADPLSIVGYYVPAVVALAAIGRTGVTSLGFVGLNALIIFSAAAWYFFRWLEQRESRSLVLSMVVFNLSQVLLWTELKWSDPQLFLMPLGLSLIGLVEGLSKQLSANWKTGLRYAGSLAILVSPTFHIVGGGWLPLLTLMAASIVVCLLGIGLQLRPILYSGTAFLIADIIGLVVQGSLERVDVLWIAGIAMGTLVVGLAAYCENHREIVLQRVRWLSATLKAWE
ncbi:hypothetical protein [Planctellipticum variicoloris]|uniref:hypothetical protein n=1 Tax=Planctellipticum variicoloris TaxID=3064265 RepID=UPI0030133F35|nr:hypothetical protein SH412_001850 [Planctomycetaceae bacterium SH412]